MSLLIIVGGNRRRRSRHYGIPILSGLPGGPASPLGWAIHGWTTVPSANERHYPEVVALLVGAGAEVNPEWLSHEKLASDPE